MCYFSDMYAQGHIYFLHHTAWEFQITNETNRDNLNKGIENLKETFAV